MSDFEFWSLFSGMGGFDLGLERADMRCAKQCENNSACQRVLKRHWPEVELDEDIQGFDCRGPVPSLICGGFPCQDLSVAGRRAGLAGGRSGLWYRFAGIVKQLSPAWVLIENVVGLLSSHKGRDMATILTRLGELGYGYAYRVLDLQWFGCAQRRKHVFIVGCLGNVRGAAEVLFERESLPWDSPPCRKTGTRVAGRLESRTDSGGFPGTDNATDGYVVAASESGRNDRNKEDETYITKPVAFNWQAGGSEDYLCPNEEATTRLQASQTPAVMEPMVFDERNLTSPDNRQACRPGDPVPRMHEHPMAVAFRGAGQDGFAAGEVSPRIASTDGGLAGTPQVFQTRIARNGRGQPSDVAHRLGSAEAGTHADSKPHVAYGSTIRRLTPRECERLQSFPDDFSRWGDDGKEISDSARYRMLGNAVPPIMTEWIGKRMMEAHSGVRA